MIRLSNGLKYSGSTENTIPYLIFQSTDNLGKNLSPEFWNFFEEKPKGTRIYTCQYYGNLSIFKKPLDNRMKDLLLDKLETIEAKEQHPAMVNGFENEAKRLFNEIDDKANDSYKSFINFLNSEFHFEKNTKKEKDYSSYTDDIGPFLLGTSGHRSFVIPELPTIYSAPKSWCEMTWLINNYFSGPYPTNTNHPDLKPFNWNKIKLDSHMNTHKNEGLAYFLIAQFILIYEAFSQRKTCDSLLLYIDLVQHKGMRPWKDLF